MGRTRTCAGEIKKIPALKLHKNLPLSPASRHLVIKLFETLLDVTDEEEMDRLYTFRSTCQTWETERCKNGFPQVR